MNKGVSIKVRYELRHKGKAARKCKICGTSRGLIRMYDLYVCRRCFREHAKELGFEKYS